MRPGRCVLLAAGLLTVLTACASPGPAPSAAPAVEASTGREQPLQELPQEDGSLPEQAPQQNTLTVTVAGREYRLVLQDNAAARSLRERLPLTLEMQELNGNEKFFRFSEPFWSDAQAVGSISAGDVMLYQEDTLVLFYQSHDTSYHYTPIGRISNTSGLAEAVGSAAVTVTLDG